jgi:cyclopropane fatty-acyl-phospholipid synthase-like methyltransferase
MAAQEAREQGLDVHIGSMESLPQEAGQLDLITAIDLVEHLSDPKSFLDAAANRLETGRGLLYIETPNPKSVVYRVVRLLTNATSGRPRWIAERVFLREHIQYFTRTGLLSLAESAGLRPLKVAERHLHGRDISAPLPVRAAMSALQELDRPPLGSGILLWAIFRLA